VELGNVQEFKSYKAFKDAILKAKLEIAEKLMGYEIMYNSPSQG